MIVIDGKKYHVALKQGALQYGFMIVPGSDSKRRVNDWAPRYSTGDAQFAEGTWEPIVWNDWSGIGQERYNASLKTKFYSSLNIETRISGRFSLGGRWVTTDASQVATSAPIDFLGKLYLPCGTNLRKFNTTWSNANASPFSGSITHALVDGANMFLAFGAAADAQRFDGTNFTVLTNFKCNYWASFGTSLWRAYANHLYGSSDAGATFATDVTIGDASSDIVSIFPYASRLYIGKTDSLWYYDGSAATKVMDYSNQAYAGNFKFMCEWGGSLYFNILRRVIRFTTTTWNDITPEISGDANSELYGYGIPIMFCDTPDMLLVAFKDGDGTHANLLGNAGGSKDAWHQVYGPVTATMAAVGYSRANDWIVINDGATRYQAQIAQANRPAADYEASGTLITPWFDGGFPYIPKSGKSVVIETRDCTTTETVTVEYQTADGGTWTALGSTVVTSTTPTTISLAAIAGALEFYKIRFRLTLARGATTSLRPTVLRFIMQYLNRPTSVFAYSVQLKVSSKVRSIVVS